jgi:hypothetical protein
MHYRDYETMVYGEDGENPMKPTVLRCLHEAEQDGNRLKVEIRVQHLGTTSSKSEHSFVVDSKQENADVIIHNIKTRLEAAPGEGFEGQIRLNFYSAGNSGVKYGSFTRQIRFVVEQSGFPSSDPMMNMNNMFNNMNQNRQRPDFSTGFDDFNTGTDDDEDIGNAFDGSSNFDRTNFDTPPPQQNPNFDQMQQMMQMMQMMQGQNGAGGNAPVDNKMAMDWLSHTMSFLFRSLALQMSMFERSTKLVETYAMRFGLPQPLERPTPEKIIREVPMELEFPDYQPPQQVAPPPQEKPSILPQLLNAAAAFAGNPGAAQLLQTAAGMLNTVQQTPAQPQPAPQPVPRPRVRRKTAPQDQGPNEPAPRYIKQPPPQPKAPIDGADDFTWDENENEQNEGFAFGLDGSHNQINPFPQQREEMFADFAEDGDIEDHTGFEQEDQNFDFGDLDQEITTPEGFPDLTGMSADEMKTTVIEWVQADPDNRKQQIMAMLPELSSLIM